jgi:general secretion pathway protein G
MVILIIGILAALLLPGLARTKTAAHRVRCGSNLHQLGLAAHLYLDDNGGNCFRYGGAFTNGGQLYWFGWMGAGTEGQRAFDAVPGVLYPYLRGRGVELCPAFNYSAAQVKMKATGAAYGYGYNKSLSVPPGLAPVNLGKILRPVGTAMLADAAQVNAFLPPASPANPMLEEFYYVDNTTDPPNGHFRHRQKASVLFCDGHVAMERFVPGTIDPHLPGAWTARLRPEILDLP